MIDAKVLRDAREMDDALQRRGGHMSTAQYHRHQLLAEVDRLRQANTKLGRELAETRTVSITLPDTANCEAAYLK